MTTTPPAPHGSLPCCYRHRDGSKTVAIVLPLPEQEEPGPFEERTELTPEQFKTLFAFALFTQPLDIDSGISNVEGNEP